MKIKQSILSASITAALAMSVAGEAAATVYAGSRLDIDSLFVNVGSAATPQTFNFRLTNTADLASPTIASATCGGVFPSSGTCGGAGDVLNATAANAPGSSGITRADNDMTFFGPGGNYANSDSVIHSAQLIGAGNFTDTDNVAESSLDSALTGGANSEIQSITGFNFTFTVSAPGSLSLSFMADPDMRAFISAFEGAGSSAQANLNTSFTLRQDTDTDAGDGTALGFANWNPQGTAANDCTASGGVTCNEDFDTQDLNIKVGSTTSGVDNAHSYGAGDLGFGDALTQFGISVTNLDAGQWTLAVNEVKSVDLRRQVPEQVSEPGILALVGIGLLGLGMSSRRKKAK